MAGNVGEVAVVEGEGDGWVLVLHAFFDAGFRDAAGFSVLCEQFVDFGFVECCSGKSSLVKGVDDVVVDALPGCAA